MYAITVREIKNYFIAYLFDKGKSDITVNGQIKAMKQFLKYLYGEGLLNQNIAEELHVVKAEKLMLQTFTKEQVAALLEQPDEKRLPAPQFYDNATLWRPTCGSASYAIINQAI